LEVAAAAINQSINVTPVAMKQQQQQQQQGQPEAAAPARAVKVGRSKQEVDAILANS
jgi:hypothetical protein